MQVHIAARVVVEQVQSEQTETQEVALAERVLITSALTTAAAVAVVRQVLLLQRVALVAAVRVEGQTQQPEQQGQIIWAVAAVEPVRLPRQEIPQAA